jgi:dienelactone hydrolase
MSPRQPLAKYLALAVLLLGGCAGVTTADMLETPGPGGVVERIPVSITRPSGDGPFPAVVIMHDCSGLGPYSSHAPERWAQELAGHGYVIVIPDSFTTRGFPNGVCTDSSGGRAGVAPGRRAYDAYAALAHARSLPYVDGRHVGLMGGSHGGSTTLATLVTPTTGSGFAAAVALYPACRVRLGGWNGVSGVYQPAAPLLILAGALDDWTPAEPCRQMAEASRAAAFPVAIKIYPGAHHSFDSANPVRFVAARINVNAPGGRGATTGGNAEAWADSIREVVAFFGRHLAATAETR